MIFFFLNKEMSAKEMLLVDEVVLGRVPWTHVFVFLYFKRNLSLV